MHIKVVTKLSISSYSQQKEAVSEFSSEYIFTNTCSIRNDVTFLRRTAVAV